MAYYVERDTHSERVRVSELTATILLTQKAAFQIIAQPNLTILRLVPGFFDHPSSS